MTFVDGQTLKDGCLFYNLFCLLCNLRYYKNCSLQLQTLQNVMKDK